MNLDKPGDQKFPAFRPHGSLVSKPPHTAQELPPPPTPVKSTLFISPRPPILSPTGITGPSSLAPSSLPSTSGAVNPSHTAPTFPKFVPKVIIPPSNLPRSSIPSNTPVTTTRPAPFLPSSQLIMPDSSQNVDKQSNFDSLSRANPTLPPRLQFPSFVPASSPSVPSLPAGTSATSTITTSFTPSFRKFPQINPPSSLSSSPSPLQPPSVESSITSQSQPQPPNRIVFPSLKPHRPSVLSNITPSSSLVSQCSNVAPQIDSKQTESIVNNRPLHQIQVPTDSSEVANDRTPSQIQLSSSHQHDQDLDTNLYSITADPSDNGPSDHYDIDPTISNNILLPSDTLPPFLTPVSITPSFQSCLRTLYPRVFPVPSTLAPVNPSLQKRQQLMCYIDLVSSISSALDLVESHSIQFSQFMVQLAFSLGREHRLQDDQNDDHFGFEADTSQASHLPRLSQYFTQFQPSDISTLAINVISRTHAYHTALSYILLLPISLFESPPSSSQTGHYVGIPVSPSPASWKSDTPPPLPSIFLSCLARLQWSYHHLTHDILLLASLSLHFSIQLPLPLLSSCDNSSMADTDKNTSTTITLSAYDIVSAIKCNQGQEPHIEPVYNMLSARAPPALICHDVSSPLPSPILSFLGQSYSQLLNSLESSSSSDALPSPSSTISITSYHYTVLLQLFSYLLSSLDMMTNQYEAIQIKRHASYTESKLDNVSSLSTATTTSSSPTLSLKTLLFAHPVMSLFHTALPSRFHHASSDLSCSPLSLLITIICHTAMSVIYIQPFTLDVSLSLLSSLPSSTYDSIVSLLDGKNCALVAYNSDKNTSYYAQSVLDYSSTLLYPCVPSSLQYAFDDDNNTSLSSSYGTSDNVSLNYDSLHRSVHDDGYIRNGSVEYWHHISTLISFYPSFKPDKLVSSLDNGKRLISISSQHDYINTNTQSDHSSPSLLTSYMSFHSPVIPCLFDENRTTILSSIIDNINNINQYCVTLEYGTPDMMIDVPPSSHITSLCTSMTSHITDILSISTNSLSLLSLSQSPVLSPSFLRISSVLLSPLVCYVRGIAAIISSLLPLSTIARSQLFSSLVLFVRDISALQPPTPNQPPLKEQNVPLIVSSSLSTLPESPISFTLWHKPLLYHLSAPPGLYFIATPLLTHYMDQLDTLAINSSLQLTQFYGLHGVLTDSSLRWDLTKNIDGSPLTLSDIPFPTSIHETRYMFYHVNKFISDALSLIELIWADIGTIIEYSQQNNDNIDVNVTQFSLYHITHLYNIHLILVSRLVVFLGSIISLHTRSTTLFDNIPSILALHTCDKNGVIPLLFSCASHLEAWLHSSATQSHPFLVLNALLALSDYITTKETLFSRIITEHMHACIAPRVKAIVTKKANHATPEHPESPLCDTRFILALRKQQSQPGNEDVPFSVLLLSSLLGHCPLLPRDILSMIRHVSTHYSSMFFDLMSRRFAHFIHGTYRPPSLSFLLIPSPSIFTAPIPERISPLLNQYCLYGDVIRETPPLTPSLSHGPSHSPLPSHFMSSLLQSTPCPDMTQTPYPLFDPLFKVISKSISIGHLVYATERSLLSDFTQLDLELQPHFSCLSQLIYTMISQSWSQIIPDPVYLSSVVISLWSSCFVQFDDLVDGILPRTVQSLLTMARETQSLYKSSKTSSIFSHPISPDAQRYTDIATCIVQYYHIQTKSILYSTIIPSYHLPFINTTLDTFCLPSVIASLLASHQSNEMESSSSISSSSSSISSSSRYQRKLTTPFDPTTIANTLYSTLMKHVSSDIYIGDSNTITSQSQSVQYTTYYKQSQLLLPSSISSSSSSSSSSRSSSQSNNNNTIDIAFDNITGQLTSLYSSIKDTSLEFIDETDIITHKCSLLHSLSSSCISACQLSLSLTQPSLSPSSSSSSSSSLVQLNTQTPAVELFMAYKQYVSTTIGAHNISPFTLSRIGLSPAYYGPQQPDTPISLKSTPFTFPSFDIPPQYPDTHVSPWYILPDTLTPPISQRATPLASSFKSTPTLFDQNITTLSAEQFPIVLASPASVNRLCRPNLHLISSLPLLPPGLTSPQGLSTLINKIRSFMPFWSDSYKLSQIKDTISSTFSTLDTRTFYSLIPLVPHPHSSRSDPVSTPSPISPSEQPFLPFILSATQQCALIRALYSHSETRQETIDHVINEIEPLVFDNLNIQRQIVDTIDRITGTLICQTCDDINTLWADDQVMMIINQMQPLE